MSLDCPNCGGKMIFDEIKGWYQCTKCNYSLHHCGSSGCQGDDC